MTQRCNWVSSEALAHYHDTEWGVPSRDDQHLFEMLVLEGAQAGLSWSTILNKRGRLSPRVRRLRDRQGRALHAEARGCAGARRKHRAPSRQDRGGDHQRARRTADPGRTRLAREFRLVVRRSDADPERLGLVSARARLDRDIGRTQQRAQALRLQVRRHDDLLCVHAGRRHGERPSDELHVPRHDARRSAKRGAIRRWAEGGSRRDVAVSRAPLSPHGRLSNRAHISIRQVWYPTRHSG